MQTETSNRDDADKTIANVAGELATLSVAAHAMWQRELGNRLAEFSERLMTAKRLYNQVIWDLQERLNQKSEQASADVVKAALAGIEIAKRGSDESNDRS